MVISHRCMASVYLKACGEAGDPSVEEVDRALVELVDTMAMVTSTTLSSPQSRWSGAADGYRAARRSNKTVLHESEHLEACATADDCGATGARGRTRRPVARRSYSTRARARLAQPRTDAEAGGGRGLLEPPRSVTDAG